VPCIYLHVHRSEEYILCRWRAITNSLSARKGKQDVAFVRKQIGMSSEAPAGNWRVLCFKHCERCKLVIRGSLNESEKSYFSTIAL